MSLCTSTPEGNVVLFFFFASPHLTAVRTFQMKKDTFTKYRTNPFTINCHLSDINDRKKLKINKYIKTAQIYFETPGGVRSTFTEVFQQNCYHISWVIYLKGFPLAECPGVQHPACHIYNYKHYIVFLWVHHMCTSRHDHINVLFLLILKYNYCQ